MGVLKLIEYWINEDPDLLKKKEMGIKAPEENPWLLEGVHDRFKKQEKCNKAVRMDPWFLQYVPDWFVTQQKLKIWHDDVDYDDDDKLNKSYDGYQKRKAGKSKIKEELLPIAWHPDRVMD